MHSSHCTRGSVEHWCHPTQPACSPLAPGHGCQPGHPESAGYRLGQYLLWYIPQSLVSQLGLPVRGTVGHTATLAGALWAVALSASAVPCQPSLSVPVLLVAPVPLDVLQLPQLLNELNDAQPWKCSPQGTAELGKISPRLPSCRASFKKLITFLINVNHVRGGSQRRARRPLPPLQSRFVFPQRPALQGHNNP